MCGYHICGCHFMGTTVINTGSFESKLFSDQSTNMNRNMFVGKTTTFAKILA